ncbi:GGDEF domain-containing protein [Hydrogenimonas urashimensis]|uniref:GGDEF domain-containing protein n=1 Tax=Hydrogenimonas urashimensis TaxID=2740515 RepID=UPI001916315C|nr:GGDEF domain-containing protein [Hydrogenimonas urashimensis]
MNDILLGVIATLVIVNGVTGFFFYKYFKTLELCKKRLAALSEEVHAARSLDEVTGAFNYPFFVKTANVQIKLARRHRWPVTLMIVDVDQLEKINLRYSFKTGDNVLKHLTESIQSVLRSSDVLGRFGGSGIFVLMPECDIDNIPSVLERIEEKIGKTPLMQGKKRIEYRRTAGAVTMYGMHIHLNRMMELAEDALNAAKEQKKNLVVFDKEGMEVKG